jgi:uncharacterized membrane protein YccC
MKLAIAAILAILLTFFVVEIWYYYDRGEKTARMLEELELQLAKIRRDSEDLESDRAYYENPMNLEKELRSRFHYRRPDETMIVIVPPASTTAREEP